MLNHISKLSLFFVFAIAMIVTSCDKEGIDELTENFTADTELTSRNAEKGDRNNRGDKGNKGGKCFSLVYPISISYPDGTTAEAADKDALKEMKKAWKEANPDAEERPSLVFPIQIDQDGEITDVADTAALKEAKEACGGGKGDRGGKRGGKGKKCFKPVFPVTIAFADGTTVEVADKEAAKTAKKAWKEANPDAEERPSIAFPYDVQLRDSSVVTIDSEEVLATLKETCGTSKGGDRGNRGGDKGGRDGDRGQKCFKPVYPVTIVLPDGTTASIEDKAGKKAAVQAWKEANPDAEGRTKVALGFPLTVELADETQTTLNNQEELDALKASCSVDN